MWPDVGPGNQTPVSPQEQKAFLPLGYLQLQECAFLSFSLYHLLSIHV